MIESTKLIVKNSFSLNGKIYAENDEIEVNDVELLYKLNEKGFVKPMSAKEIQKMADKIKKQKNIKSKED